MASYKDDIVVIRLYQKDDWIARLCVESWRRVGFDGKFLFWSEEYKTQWLKDELIYYRDGVGNFLGQIGAHSMVDCFRKLPEILGEIKGRVIMCDTDIVMKSNPLEGDYDIKGCGGDVGDYFHFNGELIIMSNKLYKHLASLSKAQVDEIIWKDMIAGINSQMSDGHFISYIARVNGFKEQLAHNNWVHFKFYEYNNSENFEEIIETIKTRFPNER
jgi:hypothetical protein